MTHLDIHSRTLSNGLRVVLQPDPSVPIVGVAVYYDVGSKDEEPGKSGFAHLFEHMMFEGSAHVRKTEHFGHVHRFGGSANGTTNQDRTNYYESLPSHQLALGLWLEADRMRSLAVTSENFENQRQTVMEERRQRVDNSPYGQAFIRVGELSYHNWAYAHPIIGSWEDLEQAKLEDVVAFHDRYYRPDNAILSVSGDLEIDATLELVDAYFGDIAQGGPVARPDLSEPRRAGAAIEQLSDPLATLPAVMLNFQAPQSEHADFYAFEVLETLLFRGASARAHRRLVVDEHKAVQISGGYDARRGPGLFGLFGVVSRGGSMDALVDGALDEIARLAQEPVGQEELHKVTAQLRASRVFGQENVLNRALAAAHALLFHGDPDWQTRYTDGIAAVTAEDVLRCASTLDPQRRVELRVVPA